VLEPRVVEALFGRPPGFCNAHTPWSLSVSILSGAMFTAHLSCCARCAAQLSTDVPFQLFNNEFLLIYDGFHEVAY
jgi:hypothetical protein